MVSKEVFKKEEERQMAEHDMEQDHRRFKNIIRGKIRRDLGKYVKDGGIVRKYVDNQGNEKEIVRIPLPRLDTPRFRFNDRQQGGVGQGDGEEGDPLSGEEGDESGQAGDKPGEHGFEEFTMEEFVDLMATELELPDLTKDGKKHIVGVKFKYNNISRHGPPGMRHPKRTLRENLKRQIGSGTYDPKNPVLIPERPDFRYKSPNPVVIEDLQAVIIYIMDYSGSMSDKEKANARLLSSWISRWIGRNYKGTDERFIIHDVNAQEVEKEAFFTTTSGGGTIISSAYRLFLQIVGGYDIDQTNFYVVQFSDGENMDSDYMGCKKLMAEDILPIVNMFGYVQVKNPTGYARFKDVIRDAAKNSKFPERMRQTVMTELDHVINSLKDLFGKK